MQWLFWRRPVVSFFKPDAKSVVLVIEGFKKTWSMRKNRQGVWKARLWLPYTSLIGRAYHFEVNNGNTIKVIADPLASSTERRGGKIKSYFSDLSYIFKNKNFKGHSFRDIVIYETHLPALSRHPSAEADSNSQRGTYDSVRSPVLLDYLQRLNVALEFLPLHAHDGLLGQDWGYYSTSFHAFRNGYARKITEVNRKVMELVDALHGRGIPVILDVVFNHGGELLVKAWGENVVYRRHPNGDFCHGSGCGPTIQTEHPVVREIILQTLEHLVKYYHFDGFRFDLGALHDKQTMLAIDKCLPGSIYLIAEPWAMDGAQWGKGDMAGELAGTRWAVWNDDFRESGRSFVRGHGDQQNRDRLMCAIAGSHADDGGWALRPQQSINYLSCHDGKTLADLLEGNKQRVFLGVMLVLTAQGIPMLGEGSELMYSKHGHDNSYDRPDLNQIDWRLAWKHKNLVEAVTGLIALRKKLPHFRHTDRLKNLQASPENWDINWIYPTGYPHHDNVNAIGYELRPPARLFKGKWRGKSLIILLNGSHTGVNFHLPEGKWKKLADGHRSAVKCSGLPGAYAARDYHIHPGTGVILTRAPLLRWENFFKLLSNGLKSAMSAFKPL
jgi:pullulanase